MRTHFYSVKTFFFELKRVNNKNEYWEMKIAQVGNTHFGEALCREFGHVVYWQDLKTGDESIAMHRLVEEAKINFID
ncbi:hypothetical protein [Bacillus wiedmannii]|uniref:Uncharacterized protein n=1 Tax=Bacillus wiedmannii TaxID=1890302 RepID=A0ABD6TF78_9BACI|nr:hypothetical protein [Bacillus wiedmannii]PEO53502.1 hypothetical protein CN560_29050 [Bacillus wiedmannii]PFX51262.1 hypothetical protein COL36_27910 [Bacillus wiedmannii]PGC72577.1 hypothetical protein COM25_23070 [Bacillus wiedmannii]PHF07800.1 hypothetical protein COF84_29130 [Bacillus wiedmannii]PHG13498.1 hypothetical protein COI74_28905 [Bacillus wiedmannii]